MNTNTDPIKSTPERVVRVASGWPMLPFVLLLCLGAIALFIYSIAGGVRDQNHPYWGWFTLSLLLEPLSIVLMVGFFTLQPNEARVLVLFGEYKGTVREPGFHWGNPFYSNGPAQAGHPAPLLFRDGTGRMLSAPDGVLLGATSGERRGPAPSALGPAPAGAPRPLIPGRGAAP